MTDEEKKAYQREAQAKYRDKNHEKILVRRRELYAANPEIQRARRVEKYDPEYARQYYLANKDRLLANRKLHRKENPEIHRARNKKWFSENKERKQELGKIWQTANKDRITSNRHDREWKLKHEVWEQYGGVKCACCGASQQEFLTIDHVNGGGSKHRKEIRADGSQDIYSWLKKHKFPDKDAYRVLCMNCNWAFGMYGHCPHHPTV